MYEGDDEIGRKVEQLRVARGLSQGELSTQLRRSGLNWSQATVSKVELGQRPVRLAETGALASALGVLPEHLLPGRGFFEYVREQIDFAISEAQVRMASTADDIRGLTVSRDVLAMLDDLATNVDPSRYVVHARGWPDVIRKAVLVRSWGVRGLIIVGPSEVLELLGVDQGIVDDWVRMAREDRERAGRPEPDAILATASDGSELFDDQAGILSNDRVGKQMERVLSARFPSVVFKRTHATRGFVIEKEEGESDA